MTCQGVCATDTSASRNAITPHAAIKSGRRPQRSASHPAGQTTSIQLIILIDEGIRQQPLRRMEVAIEE